ncbi:MAG: ATP-binding cassette domain-containing protein [Candidatus Aminicenantales bacterium]
MKKANGMTSQATREDSMLEIKNLTKVYGDVLALDRFSLDLKKGEVLGLLGPNGAGKTTLISILAGTLGDFTGIVNFQGRNLFSDRRLKNRLGIVPQDMAFYDELNAMVNLLFWGGLYDVSRAELKRRAAELLELVELAEVETTCSRIAIMDRGRILAQGTLDELVRIVGERDIVEITGEFAAAPFSEALQDLAGDAVELLSVADNLALLAVSATEQIPRVMDRLFRWKLSVTDLKIKTPSLETVFLKLTGRSSSSAPASSAAGSWASSSSSSWPPPARSSSA